MAMKTERLTKKVKMTYYYKYEPKGASIGLGSIDTTTQLAYDGVCEKLGKHEDMEENLGVGFKTLETACKDGFYSLYFGKVVRPLRLVIFERDTRPHFEVVDSSLSSIKLIFIDDFGKTWALAKEGLE